MRDRFGICRECCGCEKANKNTPYSVCAGSWTQNPWPAEGFTTSDSNARLMFNSGVGARPFRASVNVQIVTQANPTWLVRLIGGASGCADGWAFDWRNEAGVESWIGLEGARQPWDSGLCGNFPSSAASTYSRTLAMCWDGVTLTAGHGVGQALIAQVIGPPPGGRFGFATGALSNVSSVKFSNPVLEFGESATRPDCPTCGFHCCHGPVPPFLIFEVSGVPSYPFSIPSGFTACSGDCATMNGTWVLSACDPNGGLSCAGDQFCAWKTSYEAPGECTGFPPYSTTLPVVITAGTTALVNGSISVSVQIMTVVGHNATRLATFQGTTFAPCVDWSDWIPLSHVVNLTNCALGTSYSARIKAA